jgi:hypothetical protein
VFTKNREIIFFKTGGNVMRKIKKVLLVLGVLGLSACGSDGGGGGGAVTGDTCGKDITSSWETQSTEAIQSSIDLSGFTIGFTRTTEIVFDSGERCEVDARITGSDCSGEIEVSNSAYVGGGSGDPGCASFDDDYTFEIGVTLMDLCDGALSCTRFQ